MTALLVLFIASFPKPERHGREPGLPPFGFAKLPLKAKSTKAQESATA
ncbi:hypothetical protein [Hoeflea ulvae]|uniref:Uncharacterized protein n=1 Tax=Hoeflea ulvae TaxID=2983764 RepID=A0ABT3YCS6_9HYPH|nr:hypothetical protein [Hoeflea ulvae]MCY0093688.1 hypothetical protein [Hoeflea ulvae]